MFLTCSNDSPGQFQLLLTRLLAYGLSFFSSVRASGASVHGSAVRRDPRDSIDEISDYPLQIAEQIYVRGGGTPPPGKTHTDISKKNS